MYSTSLHYKMKPVYDERNFRLVQIFFKAWVDSACDNKVDFRTDLNDNISVDFEKLEDALALKLMGIPDEFKNYMEIVN